jgi:transposase-like protein
MKRRKWSSEQKLKIVLEGLSGQIEIGKLCNKYQISKATILQLERAITPLWSSDFLDKKYCQERKKVTKRKSTVKADYWRPDHRVKKKRVVFRLR